MSQFTYGNLQLKLKTWAENSPLPKSEVASTHSTGGLVQKRSTKVLKLPSSVTKIYDVPIELSRNDHLSHAHSISPLLCPLYSPIRCISPNVHVAISTLANLEGS